MINDAEQEWKEWQERQRRSEKQLAQIHAHAQAVINVNAELLAAFERQTKAFCVAQAEGQTFTRRPQLGFKLVCVGDPPARVAVRPAWFHRRKQVAFDRLEIELMVQAPGPVEKSAEILRGFGLRFFDGKPSPSLWSLRCPDGAARVVETVRQFLADPAAVFPRSADHCCICGRGLTDDTSRTRGIGPECLKYMRLWPVAWDQPGALLARFETQEPAAAVTGAE